MKGSKRGSMENRTAESYTTRAAGIREVITTLSAALSYSSDDSAGEVPDDPVTFTLHRTRRTLVVEADVPLFDGTFDDVSPAVNPVENLSTMSQLGDGPYIRTQRKSGTHRYLIVGGTETRVDNSLFPSDLPTPAETTSIAVELDREISTDDIRRWVHEYSEYARVPVQFEERTNGVLCSETTHHVTDVE